MSSPLASVWFVLTKIPVVLRAAVLHTLGLTSTAKKWDLRTALIVTVIRELTCNSPPSTISQQQSMFLRDPGVKGNIWVSKTTFPAPPDDAVRKLLLSAIKALEEGGEQYATPSIEPVGGEWVGHRPGVTPSTPEPLISEPEKYESLVKDTEADITLLYFHGGSYYLYDPVSTRPNAAKFVALTRGRVFSVRYRLAPQNPFPAALLDAFVAYLSLLYPPPGALHKPVPASSIVICGDSAGGNLSLALVQTLLQIQRSVADGGLPTVLFHGETVVVPLPAGVSLNSPSLDITRSMHWSEAHAQYDYLPPPSVSPAQAPACEAWPTDPPRPDLFCEGSALCHPLVSPLAAARWDGSPPLFIVCGEEVLTDECKVVAQRAARQGVRVVWEQYEAMPHCFALVLEGNPGSGMSWSSWAKFIKTVAEKPEEISTTAEFIAAKSLERRPVDIYGLTGISDGDVLKLMRSARAYIIERFS
jgi:acetyl esterase/lipase